MLSMHVEKSSRAAPEGFNTNLKMIRSRAFLDMLCLQIITSINWYAGAIPEEGRGHPMPMPADADVHIRVRVLPAQEQPVGDLRGQPARPGVRHRDAV